MAFIGCKELMSIEIPNGVTVISDSAFRRCINLLNINIPDSVTTIGPNAFNGCERLKSIIIPESVITIGEGAFSYRSCSYSAITIIMNEVDADKSYHIIMELLDSLKRAFNNASFYLQVPLGCFALYNLFFQGALSGFDAIVECED